MFAHVRVAAFCLLCLAGCAARAPVSSIPPVPFASADACYRCLEEALSTLDESRVLSAPDIDRLVVLVVRARELGLDDGRWLERIEAAVSGRAALAPLLEMLRDWPADTSGWDADARLPHMRGQQTLRERAAEVANVIGGAELSPPVTAYLLQSFRCRVLRDEPAAGEVEAWSGDPLLTYGATFCLTGADGGERARLDALASADERWVEADVALARLDVGEGRMTGDAERRFARAVAAFPDSAALWLALALVRQARAELDTALDAYAEVLRLVPDHREALLGQAVCFTQLSRRDEAIAAASRLIDLGMYHMGEAHYWRSWNRLRSGQLDEAWADSEQALKLLYGTDAFTLSGLVALARGETAVAAERFQKAVGMDGENCLARTQLGVSLARGGDAAAAAGAFDAAVMCHVSEADARRKELEDLRQRGDASAAHLRSVEHAIAEALQAEAETALQSARAWAATGNPTRALTALAPALRHPATRTEAEALAARLAPFQ